MSDYQALHRRLAHLAETAPLFRSTLLSAEEQRWIGQLTAVIREIGQKRLVDRLEEAIDHLPEDLWHREGVNLVNSVLFEALGFAELKSPAAVQGSFIPVGHGLDAFVAVGKTLKSAVRDILIVDPYMDETVITDFLPLAPENVTTRLLSDAGTAKGSLAPAARRCMGQLAPPLEVRLAPARTLHDRLILIDGSEVWVLTQSLKDFAARSPGSITAATAETAALKIAHYEGLWDVSTAV